MSHGVPDTGPNTHDDSNLLTDHRSLGRQIFIIKIWKIPTWPNPQHRIGRIIAPPPPPLTQRALGSFVLVCVPCARGSHSTQATRLALKRHRRILP